MVTGTTNTVDFVADIICPWCFIARRQLASALTRLAAQGAQLDWTWRPFLLHPDAPATGEEQQSHLQKRFGSALTADRYHCSVEEAGRTVGIAFRYNRITRMPNVRNAHRLLLAAHDRQPFLAEALCHAFFTEGADIGDPDVLLSLAKGAGVEAQDARATLNGSAFAQDVQASDQAAKRAGIWAVPVFCLHGRILEIADLEDLAGSLLMAHQALASVTPSQGGIVDG